MNDVREHIRLAVGAVALGFLTYAEVADALVALFSQQEPRAVNEFWIQSGRLDASQVAEAGDVLSRAKTYLAPMDGALPTQAMPAPPNPASNEGDKEQSALPGPDRAMPARTILGTAESDRLVRPGVATRIGTPSSVHRDDPQAASESAERYEHRKLIGAGGGGQVAEAYDRVLRRAVAVKSLLENNEKPKASDALMAEAQLTAGLEHPNIIPVYDAGVDAAGRSRYVMRLIDEPDLDEILVRLSEGDYNTRERFTLGRLLRDFMQVCQAVEYANSRGIIHCDLKPQNIVLGPFGEVLVLDWGLAHDVASQVVSRGGTPGYMAPEQVDPAVTTFDARTDVFAMGAILYQILTGLSAFQVDTVSEYLKLLGKGAKGAAVIVPPHTRCPNRGIPRELSDICMRALAMPLGDRLPSARELGNAIESFLDRTEDLKRRKAEADKHIEAADELSARYHEFAESRPEQTQELLDLRSQIHPWDPVEKKSELWDAEALVNVTTLLRIRTLQAAVASYEQALELTPNHQKARSGLARLYWAELADARQRRDEPNQIYFEGLVRRYDDGALVETLNAPATLVVSCDDKVPALLSIATLSEQGRRLTVVEQLPLEVGVSSVELRPGQYSLRVSHQHADVRFPLCLEAGENREVTVDTRILTQLDEDEVYIPGGETLLTADPSDPNSPALHLTNVPSFAIRRFPITFAEYLEFLDDQRNMDLDISSLIPSDRKGIPYWLWDKSWEPNRMPGPKAMEQKLRLPAFGVTAIAAEAFTKWLSESKGRQYRLPHNREWEKAGRGTDGRRYPWGDQFDALFCKMRDSREGLPTPEPVGTFEDDVSPYGVRDLAGTIAEWVLPDEGYLGSETEKRYYSRGGAWCDWEIDCGLGRRRIYFARERSARVGFRVVRQVASALTSRPTPVPPADRGAG